MMMNQLVRMIFRNGLIGFVFAFCLVMPQGAHAQYIQFDFAQMPDNLKMDYETEGGAGWTVIYRGQQDGLFVLETLNSNGTLRYTAYHSAEGHLLYRTYTDGNKRRFIPHHCGRVIGNCQFTFENSQGGSGRGTATLTQVDETYTYAWVINGTTRETQFSLGQLNIAAKGRFANGTAWQLTKMEVLP